MVRAVKAVSGKLTVGVITRGFHLFAFGGNGPVVAAAEIANLLDMSEVVVPPTPGVFSAFGLLLSDVEHEINRAWLHRLADAGPADMENAYATLKKELCEVMADEGYGQSDYSITPARPPVCRTGSMNQRSKLLRPAAPWI